VCGTNLIAVSQALTGAIPQPAPYTPPDSQAFEIERRRDMASGVRLTILGGAFVAWQFFKFVFSGFHNSPLGFWSFIGLILLAVGISKIIASRPPVAAGSPAPAPHQTHSMWQPDSNPALPAPPLETGLSVPQTSELEPAGRHIPSVIEDETRQLPHGEPTRELMK
jgi:hypothetical protein